MSVDAITDGAELGEVVVELTPFQVALRARGVLPVFVVCAVLAAGGFSLQHTDSPVSGLAPFAAVVGTIGLAAILLFAFTFSTAAYYQGCLAERFPRARVVSTETGIWLADASRQLLGRTGGSARLQSYLLVGAEGLSFWSRDDLVLRPFLAIPRSRIIAITDGQAAHHSAFSGPFVYIRIARDDGTEYPLSFTPQAPRFRGVSRTSEWGRVIVTWLTEYYRP